jgi:hypothetical protein
MTEVGRQTMVGRRAEVGTTGVWGSVSEMLGDISGVFDVADWSILQKRKRVDCMWDKNQVLKL